MKLGPRQVLGLCAIVLFGGMMILRLTQPSEREIMEQRLASLPRVKTPDLPFPSLDLETTPPPGTPAGATGPVARGAAPADGSEPDELSVGSKAAREDMYCAGVISAEFDARPDQHPDEMSKQIAAQLALEDAGIAKLIAEGVATKDNGAGFSLAYAARARADRLAKAERIPFEACMLRAAALPRAD